MTIPNDERRDIADALRRLYRGHSDVPIASFLDVFGADYDMLGDWPTVSSLSVRYIAGLLEVPTCRNCSSSAGMRPVGADEWFECSECHCKAWQDKIGMEVRFCPNCGAEVVLNG